MAQAAEDAQKSHMIVNVVDAEPAACAWSLECSGWSLLRLRLLRR